MLAVRARRIELPSTGWKPVILPLNYARKLLVYSRASISEMVNNINPKVVLCKRQFFLLVPYRTQFYH